MGRETNQPLLVITVIADGTIEANTFVREGMQKATDGDSVVGVALEAAVQGEAFPLAVAGVISVVAGGSIYTNANIYSDPDGKATTTAVNKPWGLSMASATAGELVPVLLGYRGTLS